MISSEFCGILHVFANFVDLLEICSSATAQNIRSPDFDSDPVNVQDNYLNRIAMISWFMVERLSSEDGKCFEGFQTIYEKVSN